MNGLSSKTHQAITALMACHAHCTMTAGITLMEGRGDPSPQHTRLVLDAAAIALATADALSRKSQYASQFAQLCADICDTCADVCQRQAETRECAAACRAAAEAVRGLDVPEKAEILAMASRVSPN